MIDLHVYLYPDEYAQLCRLRRPSESFSRTIARLIEQEPSPRPADPPEGRFRNANGDWYTLRHEPIHSERPERSLVEPELVDAGPHDAHAGHLGFHRNDSNDSGQRG